MTYKRKFTGGQKLDSRSDILNFYRDNQARKKMKL